MTSVERSSYWVIFEIKHQSIRPQPTQFQNLSKIFKIVFPGNWTKNFIFPESAKVTESDTTI